MMQILWSECHRERSSSEIAYRSPRDSARRNESLGIKRLYFLLMLGKSFLAVH